MCDECLLPGAEGYGGGRMTRATEAASGSRAMVAAAVERGSVARWRIRLPEKEQPRLAEETRRIASARVSSPSCAITPLLIARQYGNAGEREQRWHQKAPGHRETLSLSESCPQPSSISAYSLAAGEPCHERTFDGHATATGAGLLEHTFGKLRAAPLSREVLRRSDEH